MSLKLIGSFAPLLAVSIWVTHQPQRLAAESAPGSVGREASGWDNDRIRVRTVSVEPGARLAAPQGGANRVLVFLTADLDGRIPAAEATWQPDGVPEPENRGRVRVDAIVVDVKPGPGAARSATVVEARSAHDSGSVRILIDNERVTVMKFRCGPYPSPLDVPHVQPQDAVVVYLSGGSIWSASGAWGYPMRVRRGEFDVIPANAPHSFADAGGDNLEFLMVLAK